MFERGPAPPSRIGPLGGDTRWLEASSGFTAVLWAVWVIVWGDPLGDHPAYVPLAQFAPDWVWEGLALVGGVVQIAPARLDRIEARLVCSLVLGTLYGLLADGVRLSQPSTPTVPIYVGASAANFAAMLILATILMRRRA